MKAAKQVEWWTLATVPTGSAPDGSLSPSDASNQVIRTCWRATLAGAELGRKSASVVSPSFNRLSSMIAKMITAQREQPHHRAVIFRGQRSILPAGADATADSCPASTPSRRASAVVSLSYVHTIGVHK